MYTSLGKKKYCPLVQMVDPFILFKFTLLVLTDINNWVAGNGYEVNEVEGGVVFSLV